MNREVIREICKQKITGNDRIARSKSNREERETIIRGLYADGMNYKF